MATATVDEVIVEGPAPPRWLLIVTGGVLVGMGLIPGMPNFAFLSMGCWVAMVLAFRPRGLFGKEGAA